MFMPAKDCNNLSTLPHDVSYKNNGAMNDAGGNSVIEALSPRGDSSFLSSSHLVHHQQAAYRASFSHEK